MDGQWLKKDAQPPQDEHTPSPPPQRDDSSALMHEVLSKLRGLRTYVGERFDSLDGRIDAIDACFEGMDRRLQEDWAKDVREGPRVLISLRVDFGPMG